MNVPMLVALVDGRRSIPRAGFVVNKLCAADEAAAGQPRQTEGSVTCA